MAVKPPATKRAKKNIAQKQIEEVIPSTSPSVVAPAVLLAMQQAWVNDRADVAVWEKSRRIGASWCTASDAVGTASATAEDGGMDALYIGYSEDMTREFIDDCAKWAKVFNQVAVSVGDVLFEDTDDEGDIKHIKAFRIDFASGFKVLALSSRPRSIRGKQGLVIIDEAAFHDDLPGLIKAAMAMLIWGGRVRILSSHNGEDNPFNQMVKDIRAGKLPYSLHRTTFADALNAGLFERVRLVMGKRLKQQTRAEWEAHVRAQYGEGAAEELDCVPAMGGGTYLPRTLVERCQTDDCKILHWAKPPEFMLDDQRLAECDRWIADVLKPAVDNLPNIRTVKGRDFGRSGDLSVDRILQELAPGRWRAALTLELRRIPFDCQERIDQWLLNNLPLLHHSKYDARGNGQQLAEAALQNRGPARVECVMATTTWYAVNFPPYKAALEDKSVELPRGEDEIADHRRVMLKNGYPTMDAGHDKGSDGGQRHGDRAIASVLAWAATRQEGEPAAGESVEAERDQFLPDAMRMRRRATMFRKAA
ncbi:MAG: terminase family protein [Burkholderiales bacterium]